MNNWIKWWKDKTFMTVLGIALGTMGLSFVTAYFIELSKETITVGRVSTI